MNTKMAGWVHERLSGLFEILFVLLKKQKD